MPFTERLNKRLPPCAVLRHAVQGIRKVSIVAHSYGTLVASSLNKQAPGLVARLTMVDPVSRVARYRLQACAARSRRWYAACHFMCARVARGARAATAAALGPWRKPLPQMTNDLPVQDGPSCSWPCVSMCPCPRRNPPPTFVRRGPLCLCCRPRRPNSPVQVCFGMFLPNLVRNTMYPNEAARAATAAAAAAAADEPQAEQQPGAAAAGKPTRWWAPILRHLLKGGSPACSPQPGATQLLQCAACPHLPCAGACL